MKKKPCRFLALAAVILTLFLTGCATMSAEELYALPQLSDEYLQLQDKIYEALGSGAEFSAPASGTNRQAVQLEDIDGDGVREAIAFLSSPGTDKPLKIVIFQSRAGKYEEAARLEGEGSGIDCVNYVDMNGDGVKEIAVGWKIASGMNLLSVYSLTGFEVSTLLSTDYTEFVTHDLDSSGDDDIVVLRLLPAESIGEAEMYVLSADGEMIRSAGRLSSGVETIRRVRVGELIDKTPMVLVEGTVGGSGLITDVFTCGSAGFKNVAMDDNLGFSDTVRSSAVYCRDINGDGVLDVPRLIPLPTYSESVQYYIIEWYTYRANGNPIRVCTTYNNYSDYWYLTLPDDWTDKITVRREDVMSGERAIVFSRIDESPEDPEDFLVIYTLSGDNRAERAKSPGRFILTSDDEKIYAASIISDAAKTLGVTEEQVKANFAKLYSEWITGEM